jgi:hypothetical protein
MTQIMKLLKQFFDSWVFNYEDEVTAELRLEKELENLKKDNHV